MTAIGASIIPLILCGGGLLVGLVALGVVIVLIARKREPAPKTGVCPSCGAENPADHVFCDRCGERL